MPERDEITQAIKDAAASRSSRPGFANKLVAWLSDARARELNEQDKITHLENVLNALDVDDLEDL